MMIIWYSSLNKFADFQLTSKDRMSRVLTHLEFAGQYFKLLSILCLMHYTLCQPKSKVGNFWGKNKLHGFISVRLVEEMVHSFCFVAVISTGCWHMPATVVQRCRECAPFLASWHKLIINRADEASSVEVAHQEEEAHSYSGQVWKAGWGKE